MDPVEGSVLIICNGMAEKDDFSAFFAWGSGEGSVRRKPYQEGVAGEGVDNAGLL